MLKVERQLYPQGIMAVVNTQGNIVGFSINLNQRSYRVSLSALEGYIELSKALTSLPTVLEGIDRSPHLQDTSSHERYPSYDLSSFFLNYRQQLLQYITTGKVEGFSPEELTIFRDANLLLQSLNLSNMQIGGDVLRTVNDVGFILGDMELAFSHKNNRMRVFCDVYVYGSRSYTTAIWSILNPVPFHLLPYKKELGTKTSFLKLRVDVDKIKKLVFLNHDQFFLPSEGVTVKTTLDGSVIYEDDFGLRPNMKLTLNNKVNLLHENYVREDTPFFHHFKTFMRDVESILDTLSHLDDNRGRVYRDISKDRLNKPHLIMIQGIN